MPKWITSQTEGDVCRMFIGLYLVLGLLGALPAAVAVFFFFATSMWHSMRDRIRDAIIAGRLPVFERAELWAWSGMLLVAFGAVFFVQYCKRLGRREGLLPGRSLWTWTIIHMLLFLCWLPSNTARLIAMCPVWTAYFMMAIMAWIATTASTKPIR